MAAMNGDAARAEAIADALHNVPQLLREGDRWGWSIEMFELMFLPRPGDDDPHGLAGFSATLERLRSR